MQSNAPGALAGTMARAYAASSAAKAAGAEAQDQLPDKGSSEAAGCCRGTNPAWFTFLTLFRVSMRLLLVSNEPDCRVFVNPLIAR